LLISFSIELIRKVKCRFNLNLRLYSGFNRTYKSGIINQARLIFRIRLERYNNRETLKGILMIKKPLWKILVHLIIMNDQEQEANLVNLILRTFWRLHLAQSIKILTKILLKKIKISLALLFMILMIQLDQNLLFRIPNALVRQRKEYLIQTRVNISKIMIKPLHLLSFQLWNLLVRRESKCYNLNLSI
jgi:hypothetical protein